MTLTVKYYSDRVRNNTNNPKALLKIINVASHRQAKTPLPQHESEVDLTINFSELFKKKIQTIQEHLDGPHIVNYNNNTWEDQPMFTTKLTDH